MPKGWHWDFEDDHAPRKSGDKAQSLSPVAPARSSAPMPGAAPRRAAGRPRRAGPAQFRRRRLAAVGAALSLLAVGLLVVALSGSQGRASPQSSGGRADGPQPRDAAGRPSAPAPNEKQVVASTLAYTPFIKEGTERAREIALTFDDGPGPYTPEVLDALERAHVHATFFAIGRMERYFSASTVRELRDGDVVGDHTENHRALALLSAAEQHEELFEQIARIELLGGPRPALFRPPYGSFNATTWAQLHSMHLLMVLWSVDTGDYLQPGVGVIVQRVLAGAHPGAIILMHDGGGDRAQTVAALPTIIEDLRARGFHLVTVPQLLLDDPPPRDQPLPTNLSGD